MSSFTRFKDSYQMYRNKQQEEMHNTSHNPHAIKGMILNNLEQLDRGFYLKAYMNNNPQITNMAINTHYMTTGYTNDYIYSYIYFRRLYPEFNIKKYKIFLSQEYNKTFKYDEQYLAFYHHAVREMLVDYSDIPDDISVSDDSDNDLVEGNPVLNRIKLKNERYRRPQPQQKIKVMNQVLNTNPIVVFKSIKKNTENRYNILDNENKEDKNIEIDNNVIQSLWVGNKLGLIEQLCIRSYLKQGYDFHLYTYNPVDNIPDGTTVMDANKILPSTEIFYYNKEAFYDGSSEGSPSGFSNVFRYKMLYELGGIWTDMDMICINPLNFEKKYVFTSEIDMRTGKIKTNVGFIKCPAKSRLLRYCYEVAKNTDKTTLKWNQIGPQLFDEAVKKYNMSKYVLPWWDFCPIGYDNINKIFEPGASRMEDYMGTSHAIHLWGECIRREKYDVSNLKDDSLFLQLISRIFTLTGFTTVTEPIRTGYPIYECAQSCLNIMDHFYVIYGRDEESSRKKLEEMGAECIVTNKWKEDWVYPDMTYHMDLGLKSSGGDLSFKIDSDYVMSLNGLTRDKYRMKLFKHIMTHYLIYIPKINYLPYNYFLMMEKGVYCINKYLLSLNNVKFEIAVDKGAYVNKLFIHCNDVEARTIITKDKYSTVFNYDCTEMTKDWYLYKQRGWFNAYYKFSGDISKFNGLTVDILKNDEELIRKIRGRFSNRILWAIKKEQLYNRSIEFNPPEIRDKLLNLKDDQYGKTNFNDWKLRRTLENYMLIYNRKVVHYQ